MPILLYLVDKEMVPTTKYHKRCNKDLDYLKNNQNVRNADVIFLAISWDKYAIEKLSPMLEIFKNNYFDGKLILVSQKISIKNLNFLSIIKLIQ